MDPDVGLLIDRGEIHDRSPPEDPPGHGRSLQYGPLLLGQSFDPSREDALHAVRRVHRGFVLRGRPTTVASDEPLFVYEHPDDLLDEERIPVSGLGDTT